MATTTLTNIQPKEGQKFWPLKKFGLNHGKLMDQTSISSVKIEKGSSDKKSKNKRLSSLLSSRRQDTTHDTQHDIISAEIRPAKASLTPNATKKPGKETRTRTMSQNIHTTTPKLEQRQNHTLTPKSSGVSGNILRNNGGCTNNTNNKSQCTLKSRESRTGRRSSDDRTKTVSSRPHSPPSKRNDSPTQQPTIMSESVQRQLQQELEDDCLDNDIEEYNTSPPPSPPTTPDTTSNSNNNKYDTAIAQEESFYDASLHSIKTDDQQTNVLSTPPIQRIHRLRPAASFATLRQLANTHGVMHQPHYLKKRPTSFIDCNNRSTDEYIVNNRPIYLRRASHEDHHIHTHDAASVISNGRRLIRSNTVQPVHNIIIQDGQGHRIIQCVELDQSPTTQQQIFIRKNNDSFGSNESFANDITNSGLITPTDLMDPLSDDYMHPNRHYQSADMNDTSSSDSGSQERMSHGYVKKVRRKDSVKSVNSLCSNYTNTTVNGHFQHSIKCEQLKYKLDNERLIVKSLQKQKEACNKDILFLSKNTDDLVADNAEWKKKYENEKINAQRYQDDTSMTKRKLNEAIERIRHLDSQNKLLKLELASKDKEMEEYQKRKPRIKPSLDGNKANDRLISAQLLHSQNQVRLLKSTMEQFLRMGVFNDDLNSSLSNITSPTTSVDSAVSEFRYERCRRKNKHTLSTKPNGACTEDTLLIASKEVKEDLHDKAPDPPEVKVVENTTQDLDTQLRELLREKEILQAEYSKTPSSGGNALVRRRREELESRLDDVDSHMSRIKLKMRNRNII